ncbi:MAG: tRNA 2-thiouridine(34) synthase MnmA, partial [bacterium]|nr:tRNA 2-thiouridine(34) synthase MnmA [bacterium]
MKHKLKILVAMSGGVDSAVAATLLKKQGCDVTGVFMINWSENEAGERGSCSWERDQADARLAAQKIGINLFTWDFSAEYKKFVFEYFLTAYQNGLTPNPDTLCNKYIKFGTFLTKAKALGFDKIATGHYAQIKEKNGQFELFAGRDQSKDQSYFLYELGQKELSQTLFPLGKMKKKKVRRLAKKFGLAVADKKDSYGICYIGKKNMKEFLGGFIKKNPGPIIDQKGQIIGEHEGLHAYTLGQRQGIGIGGRGPFYVVEKRISDNSLIVTNNPGDPVLYKKEITVDKLNWISDQPTKLFNCLARFRHLQKLIKVRAVLTENNQIQVVFN